MVTADVREGEGSPAQGPTPLARRVGRKVLLLFVVGDILGAGIYALTGEVAGEVGGALWIPFLVAFGLAALTATSYVELVSRYPRAAGAALYANRAFRRPFLTFLVGFAVMMSGVTSASAAARAFGGDYLAVAVVSGMLVETSVLEGSSGPLLEVVRVAGWAFPTWLFAVIALLAVGNTALINVVMASRLVYGMAQERIVPRVLGHVHPRRRTPVVAIAFTVAVALALVSTGDLAGLADTTVLLLLLVFAVVNVSVLVLRRERDVPEADQDVVEGDRDGASGAVRPYRAPTWAPVAGVVVCLILASPLTGRDADVYVRAALLLAVGAALHVVNRLLARRAGPPGRAPAHPADPRG